MTTIVEVSRHNNGTYCGSDSIRMTQKGAFALVRTSNGQDMYRKPSIEAVAKEEIATLIDGWKLSDEEHEKLIELGIVEDA